MECPAITLIQNFPFKSGSCAKIGLNCQVMDKAEKHMGWGSHLSDEQLSRLVNLSRAGDIQAMESIYNNFKSSLFSLALRYTYNSAAAEDLIQDIFIKVFTNIHTLDDDKAFVGWLYRISVNTCLSYLRGQKKRHQKTVSLDEVHGYVAAESTSYPDRAANIPLEEAVQSLPAKIRSVFLLHDVQGFKHQEIATILGCSVGTSKSQLFKARIKIRKYLKKRQWL